MHMDLKASNVLLTQTYSIAKIGDVGMAQVMGSSRAGRPRPATFAYSAPELILNGACTEKVQQYLSSPHTSSRPSPTNGLCLLSS